MMKCNPPTPGRTRSLPVRLAAVPFSVLILASCADHQLTGPESTSADAAGKKNSVTVDIVAPHEGATLSGVVEFRAALSNLRPAAEYEMFWQVDDGVQNRMSDRDAVYKTAAVDVSGWNWRGSGPYTVKFVARERRNNRLIAQESVTVQVATSAPPPVEAVTGADLFASQRLWVNPNSRARQQADLWRESRPDDAAQMDKIAGQPDAQWFGDWNGDIAAAVAQMTHTITQAGRLPVYVAYNIPVRDCNSYSAGGATSAAAYRSWIREFARGLGTTRAVVILEPDALAAITCLSSDRQAERYALLADAVSVLKAQGSAVYIDAGHSRWVGAADMAARLDRANISEADGFTLNVSNFQTTQSNIDYGVAVSGRLAVSGRQFIVDTSRNGLGPTEDNAWCNPDGRALGASPGTMTAHPLAVAYLWVKKPGESDGTCNGGPSAGSWWADYALGLAARAPVMVAYGG
jgi:endoglucanase